MLVCWWVTDRLVLVGMRRRCGRGWGETGIFGEREEQQCCSSAACSVLIQMEPHAPDKLCSTCWPYLTSLLRNTTDQLVSLLAEPVIKWLKGLWISATLNEPATVHEINHNVIISHKQSYLRPTPLSAFWTKGQRKAEFTHLFPEMSL